MQNKIGSYMELMCTLHMQLLQIHCGLRVDPEQRIADDNIHGVLCMLNILAVHKHVCHCSCLKADSCEKCKRLLQN